MEKSLKDVYFISYIIKKIQKDIFFCLTEISDKCPMVQSRSQSACERMGEWKNECESDLDCSNNTDTTVCCYNGCRGECRVPEFEKCIYEGHEYKTGETFSPESCKVCFYHSP